MHTLVIDFAQVLEFQIIKTYDDCILDEMVGLHFKRVGRTRPVYSIRIRDYYRALGLLHGDTITWFWIGNHDVYERLVKDI